MSRFSKLINMAVSQGIIKPVTPKSKPQTVNTIAPKSKTANTLVPKSKPVKYASIGRKQMRMGRSGTIVTSGGLLANNKTTIKKKKLLGS